MRRKRRGIEEEEEAEWKQQWLIYKYMYTSLQVTHSCLASSNKPSRRFTRTLPGNCLPSIFRHSCRGQLANPDKVFLITYVTPHLSSVSVPNVHCSHRHLLSHTPHYSRAQRYFFKTTHHRSDSSKSRSGKLILKNCLFHLPLPVCCRIV